MEISGVNSLYGAVGETARDPVSVLGKDDFLRLLTVQLQHQDPLSPLDNEDLIAQLAQFSSLEQLENINTNLENAMDLDLVLTQVLNNTAAAGLIGKTVIAQGDEVDLASSGSAEIHFDLASEAERVVITVTDETGAVVRKIEHQEMEQGRHCIDWDGKDNEGHSRSEGKYLFRVEAYGSDDTAVDVTTLVLGEIAGVKFVDGAAVLIVGGLEIGISEILEILAQQPA